MGEREERRPRQVSIARSKELESPRGGASGWSLGVDEMASHPEKSRTTQEAGNPELGEGGSWQKGGDLRG